MLSIPRKTAVLVGLFALVAGAALAWRLWPLFFRDNGLITRFMPESWKPRGGKGSAAEGGIRIPMIIAGPGVRVGRTEALAELEAFDRLSAVLDGHAQALVYQP